jgi:hypothetical protein
MKITNTCAICNQALSLSRREIHAITHAVKGIGKGRVFVPDEEVYAIIHRVHSQTPKDQSAE